MKKLILLMMMVLSTISLSSQIIDSILLTKLENLSVNNSKITLPDIVYFNSMKNNEQEMMLETILRYLNTSDTSLEMIIHSDCRGTEDFNADITEMKADIMQRWFLRKGIDKNRIIISGVGESIPLINCEKCEGCTEDDYQTNKRIELILL